VAAYVGIAQIAGYWVTAGVYLAFALVAWSLLSMRRRAFIVVRLVSGTIGLAAIWFLVVDWSWYVDYCPDCLSVRHIVQYRILGYPVHCMVDKSPTIIEQVLADMGAPCHHDRMQHWHKHRWWGLLFCGWPCWNGILSLAGDDDLYTQELSARLRERGRTDPAFAAELHRRVVGLHDYDFFWDAFMVDELASQWVDAASTREALSWLKGSSGIDDRSVNQQLTTDDSIKMVEAAYKAGATEVLAVGIQDYCNCSKEQAGMLLVKLPREELSRQHLLAWVDQHDPDSVTPRQDFGQSYVRFFP
jgi:hypothetical protein